MYYGSLLLKQTFKQSECLYVLRVPRCGVAKPLPSVVTAPQAFRSDLLI